MLNPKEHPQGLWIFQDLPGEGALQAILDCATSEEASKLEAVLGGVRHGKTVRPQGGPILFVGWI